MLTTSQCEVWHGTEKQTGRTDGRGTGDRACDLELVFIFLNVEFGFFLYSNRITCRLYSILGVCVFQLVLSGAIVSLCDLSDAFKCP